MKVVTRPSSDLLRAGRLDAAYFLDQMRDSEALAEASGHTMRSIGTLGEAYAPGRFKRTYAVPGENAVPYLRPYDVFEFLPPAADLLSVPRTSNLDNYLIREGDILQTCSGRNLGPVTIADSYLAQFALSHDMVRLRITNEDERLYVLAFLRGCIGQQRLRSDRAGSVISHITTKHVEAVNVPFIDGIFPDVVDLVRRAIRLRETARAALQAAVDRVEAAYPNPSSSHPHGWTSMASSLTERFDAAYHSYQITDAQSLLQASGGLRLGDVASVVKPGGRHKMVYVAPGQGRPLLSGRQILQSEPVAMKYLSPHATHSAEDFALKAGSVIFQADGRAEEGLGYPALVTAVRDGWLASGHVGRAIPKVPADAGWVWASMASDVVRTQVTALSTGSVVDALYPEDLDGVVLPPRDAVDSIAVMHAWEDMAESSKLLDQATALIDEALEQTL